MARAWVEAWNRGDHDTFFAMLAPDVEWHDRPEYPDAGVYRGREAVIEHVRELVAPVEANWEIVGVEALGDRAVMHTRLTLRGRSSGAAVADDVYPVVTVRDGLVARRENYSTHAEAVRAAQAGAA